MYLNKIVYYYYTSVYLINLYELVCYIGSNFYEKDAATLSTYLLYRELKHIYK
jgi:hypothetical protein